MHLSTVIAEYVTNKPFYYDSNSIENWMALKLLGQNQNGMKQNGLSA